MPYSRSIAPIVVAASVLLSAPVLTAPASAAVYSPQQALPSAAVQQFLANPQGLLSQYPNGGPQLTKAIRDLAASDPSTLATIVGLLKSASPDQATAIGAGLGQVAELAVSADPAFADQIQTAVVSSQNVSAVVAFSAVVGGDIKLAAATGGGGGGGGEAPTNNNSGTGTTGIAFPLNLNTAVDNTPDSFPSLTFSGSGPGTPGSPGTPGTTVSSTTP